MLLEHTFTLSRSVSSSIFRISVSLAPCLWPLCLICFCSVQFKCLIKLGNLRLRLHLLSSVQTGPLRDILCLSPAESKQLSILKHSILHLLSSSHVKQVTPSFQTVAKLTLLNSSAHLSANRHLL